MVLFVPASLTRHGDCKAAPGWIYPKTNDHKKSAGTAAVPALAAGSFVIAGSGIVGSGRCRSRSNAERSPNGDTRTAVSSIVDAFPAGARPPARRTERTRTGS